MKVEIMIYIYIAICISMIAFNIVYVFILRNREKNLSSGTEHYKRQISQQIARMQNGYAVESEHKEMLSARLKKTAELTAFDKAMETFFQTDAEAAQAYIRETLPVFNALVEKYQKRDEIIVAYFPHIIGKYKILDTENPAMMQMMYNLLKSENVYCRENALSAIYASGRVECVVTSIKIIDQNKSFHHPKLICDGLIEFAGDKQRLAQLLLECFDGFTIEMQLNILNFIRFVGLRFDDVMLNLLLNEKKNQELHFSAIRYFEKFYCEGAREIIQRFAEGNPKLPWQYQAISVSTLRNYPDAITEEILKKNLSSSNWYVRLNSAKVCEDLGYTYTELIDIFDGDDRYAREILRYRLDRRAAEEMAVK